MPRSQREAWLRSHGFQNVDAICGAAEKPDRPTIQRCGAMLLNESSGGYNLYGHEGPLPELWGQEVTEANYQLYKAARERGEGNNGVGPTQITSTGLQIQAQNLGGCWNPLYNMDVGFHFLHELIERYGVWGGARSYNGSGPAAERYADEFLFHERMLIEGGLR